MKERADTADAVRAIKEREPPKTTATIASKKATKLYKMKILEGEIRDLKFNFTTFLAVRPKK